MKQKQKMKLLLGLILSVLLLGSDISCYISYASSNVNMQETDGGGGGSTNSKPHVPNQKDQTGEQSGNQASYKPSTDPNFNPDAYVQQNDLGLRIYVTDQFGEVLKTDARTNYADCIDFWYRNTPLGNAKARGVNGTTYLRCTNNPKAGYTSAQRYINELGFEPNYITDCSRKNSNCICQKEYFVDRNWHALEGPVASTHILKLKLYDSYAEGTNLTRAENLLSTYWKTAYENYKDTKKAEAGNNFEGTIPLEYYMHVELVVGITHHQTSPNAPEWYGSVFELGCLSQSTFDSYRKANNKNGKYTNGDADYLRYVPQAFYIRDVFPCFQGFQYMNPVNSITRKNLKLSDIQSKAYGIYSISFGDFIQIDIDTEETDVPTDPGVIVQKADSAVISKVSAVNNVEIRTGYAAQNGYYDIGVQAGIPTTEEIRNVIEAQDCIIDYGYVYEKYIPEKFPTVTYQLDYYVPCTCTKTVDDYGITSNGKWGIIGSHEERDDHGNQYHTETLKINSNGKTIFPFVTVPRAATYFRITDYMVYGLDSVTVANACGSANYDNLSPINNVTAIISGEINPTDITNVALDTHVDYRGVTDLSFNHYQVNGGVFSNKSAAEQWLNNNAFAYADEHVGVPKIANDYLSIEFNDDRGTVVLMDNKWCERESMNSDFVVVPPYPTTAPRYRLVKDSRDNIEIPYGLMNGKYYTNITALYQLYAGTNKHGMIALFENPAAPNHLINDTIDLKVSPYNSRPTVSYASQEPIHVITPVISPFHTNDSNRMEDLTDEQKNSMTEEEIKEYERKQSLTGTQLVNEDDCQQLRVDETYTVTFDPAMHQVWLGYGYSGLIDNENFWNGYYHNGEAVSSNNKYDKYVASKQVKFPFDVYIQNKLFTANSWIRVYEYDPVTKTVSAGDLDTPLLTDVEYYIPSWAVNSMKENSAGRGMIETAVLALNFNDSDIHGTTFNPDDPQTWSMNAIDVQLSGWMYDFKITGTNDKLDWTSVKEYDEYWIGWDEGCVSFSDQKNEYYMGLYNRLGQDNTGRDTSQRRDKDGSLDNNVSEKTSILPLQEGSSKYIMGGGELGLGSEFTFTLKTMDNLKDIDGISIKPTFTYYSDDFNTVLTMDDMELYYTSPATKQAYVKYGSSRDVPFLMNRYYNLFNKSIFTKEEFIYTAKHNSHANDLWTQGITDERRYQIARRIDMPNGSFSDIGLTDWAMIYAEPLPELKINIERDETEKLFTNVLKSPYKDGNISLDAQTDELSQSVQQWNGHYYIPDSLKILNLQKLHDMGYTTLDEYWDAHTYLTGMEDFWIEEDNGYLILNFQITAYKDKKPYMTMESGSSDQWIRQGRKDTIHINTFFTRREAMKLMKTNHISFEEALKITGHDIEMKSGDIAVIRLSNHVDKRFGTEAVAFS